MNGPYYNKNVSDLMIQSRPGIATLISPQHKPSTNLTTSLTKKRDLPMTNKIALNSKLLNKPNISSAHYQSNTDTLHRTIPNPTPLNPSEDERMHLLTLNPREFFKYKYEKSITNSHENMDQSDHNIKSYNGLLYIHLLAGRGLRLNDLSNSTPTSTYRDLYCVIECDRAHKARTVVRSGESSFDFDE